MDTVPAYARGGLMPNLGQATDQATTTPATVASQPVQRSVWMGWGLIAGLSILVSAYHGYRRSNGDYGSAAGWGIMGGLFPLVVPAVALIQGYAKPKVRSNRRKKNRSRRRG